jgi:3-isopropylmalate/(R)-2-methylmalate dehydratase large subunit
MMTAMTLTEKIIARAAGRDAVQPGDEVWATADRMIMNDSSGPRRIAGLIEDLGGLWDRERVVLASDHFIPAANQRHAEILKTTREWAHGQQVPNFFEYRGILHNLMLQEWLALPGMLVVGADSHTVSAGAAGAVAVAVGSTELATVLATGQVWLRVPESVRIDVQGTLPPLVDLRDVTMRLLGDLKADFALYRAIEFGGSFVENLSVEERLVLSNQGIEMGSKNAIVVPTQTLLEAIVAARVNQTLIPLYPDAEAGYEARHHYDVSQLEPLVAAPHAVDNILPAAELAEVTVDAAWIGSCVGGRYEDLRAVAEVLIGQRVRVPLLVTPATQAIYRRCLEDGTLQTLLDAGAIIQPAGCGACAGLHSGVLAADETVITTATRNFRGRMGSRDSNVYLASPYTVAASAVAGRIIDPRQVLAEAGRS